MTERPASHVSRQRRRLTASVTDLEVTRQRAMLVSVATGATDVHETEQSLAELALLTDTAGSDAVETVLVRRDRFNAATLMGSGKLSELVAESKALDVDVVVFDNELTPAQQRNLEKAFETDVVDRVALILDIFAQHAHTKAGMLQVELAQHRYRLPRLAGMGTALSRLGAGIGTRGPGETKLETDRRRIRERMSRIERELKESAKARATQGKARARSGHPTVGIVGYTNAGKSTLFNRLTDGHVIVENRLFATLDSTVRRLDLPEGHEALISDTVGFVRRLPHELIEAFKSTLEEVAGADLLLHVVDSSDADPERQVEAVRTVLTEIGAAEVPELLVFNKIDVADAVVVQRLRTVHPGSVALSALTGEGLGELQRAIIDGLRARTVELHVLVPYDRGDVVAALHRDGEVLKEEHKDTGTEIVVRIPAAAAGSVSAYRI
jgi:GTPase